jgi:hypothetical protein
LKITRVSLADFLFFDIGLDQLQAS